MSDVEAVGFYGKLPSAGDFVQRRLPPAFVEAWDAHFASAVAASRASMGTDDWRAAYLASPVWRFLLAPQVCGPSAWAGVVGPGVDRAGRCFPMVIAAALAGDARELVRILDCAHGFEAAERVHLGAQADARASVDAFDDRVAALAAEFAKPPCDPMASLRAAGTDGLPLRIALPSHDAFLPSLLREIWTCASAIQQRPCLWWTTGRGRVPACALVTEGLPPASLYPAFLDAHRTDGLHQVGTFDEASARTDSARPTVAVLEDAQPAFPDSRVAVATATQAIEPVPVQSVAATAIDDVLDLLDAPAQPATGAASQRSPGGGVAAAHSVGPKVAVIHRDDCNLDLVAADCSDVESGANVIAEIADGVHALDAGDPSSGLQSLRGQLLRLHAGLSDTACAGAPAANCAVAVLRIAGEQAFVLRIGAAGAWVARAGRVMSLFTETSSVAAQSGAEFGGEFDDLLFGDPSPVAHGIGAAGEPACDQSVWTVMPGDRFLLAATPRLLQLSSDIIVAALSMPVLTDARDRITAAAGLAITAELPFMVVQAA